MADPRLQRGGGLLCRCLTAVQSFPIWIANGDQISHGVRLSSCDVGSAVTDTAPGKAFPPLIMRPALILPSARPGFLTLPWVNCEVLGDTSQFSPALDLGYHPQGVSFGG